MTKPCNVRCVTWREAWDLWISRSKVPDVPVCKCVCVNKRGWRFSVGLFRDEFAVPWGSVTVEVDLRFW